MDAIILIVVAMAFAFFAGSLYGSGERVLGVGVLAFGLGTALIRNPFPSSDGTVYPIVATVLVVGGAVVLGVIGTTRLVERLPETSASAR